MILYKTLKEKAKEWNISLRKLQYLCSKGKIDGATKKAGAWFIPDSAPMPNKYAKAKNGHFNFHGTKKKIFNCSIKLFKAKGYEAVSMKDIADAVGITQSSVYNHFKSKQIILDTIYAYCRYYYLKDRASLEDIEPVLRSGSLRDIVDSVKYQFADEYLEQMTDVIIIVFHRFVIDDQAREITKSLMIDEGVRYVKAVFDRAVEIGRLAPVDTRSVALLINSISIFILHGWLATPEKGRNAQLEEDQSKLYELATRVLTDLKPPNSDV